MVAVRRTLRFPAGMSTMPAPEIVNGYRPGLIGAVTALHARHYAATAGFGCAFEAIVATGLAGFCQRLDSPANALWTIVADGEILGSIAIDGEDLGGGLAHLRWFIMAERLRGGGHGRRLLDAALAFADARGHSETHLWTFAGLDAARRLYELSGFGLAEERLGAQWGREVREQRFVRTKGAGMPAVGARSVF